ncbi:MAG: 6-carboxytetrahydropterin synthase QueD [Deltaproteobacteria bacterium]|nr:6-carboxytetrahydropterin synthase QueD [Deltaproteobacteria bacterium]MBW2050249.1 6-carboxytetrahydropterin synthase QueD [Deltaproteobacteria bacterium]MBW2112749.1 6-carboxytetrahydropterin synthase QueD [Deltaproteobacteria bacterium]MBW2354247.1 6-carboxytetrahydropterin synthase QueD [Deltaproteobacteria bacterium]HDZ89187.1 6-carboxytetrahydropterin synthase QueD [Deltaproteobacteria bacterium]
MYELKITSHFAAAHQLREIRGGCENLHGHNWKIEVSVVGRNLGNDGLLVDFREIKRETKRVMAELDHKFLNELAPFKNLEPSSENIARHIFEVLSENLNSAGVRVRRVTAWESDSACATYWTDDDVSAIL